MPVTLMPAGSDLFASGAEALVNPVNCVGRMGKGLAQQFKWRFPKHYDGYASTCRRGLLQPGGIWIDPQPVESPVSYLVALATKDHWRDSSEIGWVAQGALMLKLWANAEGVVRIACPALGCGEGGLPWPQVHDVISDVFDPWPGEILLYEPHQK